MSLTIHIYEPQSTPRKATLVLPDGESFAIYVLQDTLDEDVRDLRSTIVRRLRENPPANSVLLMELEIRSVRPGELPSLRVLKVGSQAIIELIRRDSRGRITKNNDLKSGARFEATLRDLRTVAFNIEIESELVAHKPVFNSSRASESKKVGAANSLIYLVPSVVETLAEPKAKLVAALASLAKRLGVSKATINVGILMSAAIMGMAYVAYDQYKDSNFFEEQLALKEAELQNMTASRNQAVGAEQTCRDQRKELTAKLDDIEETRRLEAEGAMEVTHAQAIAVELGGAKMGSDEILAFDGPATANMKEIVVTQMAALQSPLNDALVCRGHADKLGQDLPEFMLSYHPLEDQLCPEEFQVVEGGIDFGGPWGISKRTQRDFGASASVAEGEDARLNDRYSADAYTNGVRTVMKAIMETDLGQRSAVNPGELHFWTLALFDGYNRMTSVAEGVGDMSAAECIEQALEEYSQNSELAEPGQAVLPPIADVITGKQEVKFKPTQACPWPSDSVDHGAKALLRAVTQTALIRQALSAEGDAEEG